MTQFTLETPFRLIFGTRFITITLVAIVLMLAPASTAKAQWGTSGTNIYNSNSGNVGVGTSTPAAKLEVSGDNALPRITNTNASSYGGLELFEGGTLKFGLHTMGSASGSAYVGGANALQLWNYANSPMVFGTNSNERMRIDANGNVGIGVVPVSKFEIGGSDPSQLFGRITNTASAGTTGWTAQNDISKVIEMGVRGSTRASYGALVANDAYVYGLQNLTIMADGGVTKFATGGNTERMRIDASGNVGIGTTSPGVRLDVRTDSAAAGSLVGRFGNDNASGGVALRVYANTAASSTLYPAFELTDNSYWLASIAADRSRGLRFRTGSNVSGGESGLGDRMVITPSGNVGIGTTNPQKPLDVVGDVNASGTITGGTIVAKYQDVAEWVPASHALSAGTVVTLDPTKSNHVEASSQSYDTRVAGVVSEQPGITLGESGENKVLVATTGRVRVTVDASHAPIHIGDLLVTSDIQGVAMKSEPITIGGRQIHSPGTLIGKALEPLEKGSGKILVLLSLQ